MLVPSLAAVALVAVSCGGSSSGRQSESLRFPEGFLFGSAIAGFQVEMGCPTLTPERCEDRNSDWYQFITDPSFTGDPAMHILGDPPSSGPGFRELYEADLERAQKELGSNALRLSIEWSRVFPTATDGLTGDALRAAADPDALAYYHALFAAMKARGLKPLVTLNHYTLPTWIHDAVACHADFAHCTNRGWADRERIVREIARYAGFVAGEFGGEVDLWATLNEPLTAVVLPGFLFQTDQRTNPPGVSLQTDAAHTALAAMMEAHAAMYDAVHAADQVDADGDGTAARVGVVYNLEDIVPSDPDKDEDVTGAKNAEYLINQAFLDGTVYGRFDPELTGTPTMRDDLAGRMDFIGVNYYARLIVQGTPSAFLPQISPLLTFNPVTLEYDYGDPKGIYDVLMYARRWGVPLMITETGVTDPDDDGASSKWIAATLSWVARAIADGAPVEGYFYWTLMDNYEWNHGMSIRMGLYGVDKDDASKARHARSGVATFQRIASDGVVPADLAAPRQ